MNYRKPKKSSDKKRLFVLACAFATVACLPATMGTTVSKDNEAEKDQPTKVEQSAHNSGFNDKGFALAYLLLLGAISVGITVRNVSRNRKEREKRASISNQINKLNHK